jgi:protease-4
MFSRRHPFLFFILTFTGIMAAAMVCLSLISLLKSGDSEFIMGEKVGVVKIEGILSDPTEIIQSLKRFRENKAVKAVVIRINSPGGAVGPAQEIYREIRKTVSVKKVIASMGTVAASGGYYVAAGANGIMANPGTVTGSIGVIMGFTNMEDLLGKIGLAPVVVKSGEYKDIGSPTRPMTEAERVILNDLAKKIHKQFIAAIAEGRKMDPSKVATLADGRIYSGEEAKNAGLVDRLGNIEDAIEWAGRLGGIKDRVTAVYAPEEKPSIMEYILESSIRLLTKRMAHHTIRADYLFTPSP